MCKAFLTHRTTFTIPCRSQPGDLHSCLLLGVLFRRLYVCQSYLSPSLNKVHFCLLLLLPYVIFIFILMSMYRYLLRPWPTSSETNSIAIIEKCLKVLFGPLIPNINIHILLTILLIFLMLLVGRIGLKIKTFDNW